MPRSQGFARGDLDTSFPLDDKFLALRGRLTPERYYAAAGVYFTVVAATWREADRKVALRVVPDAPDLVEELVAVGLFGADGRLPNRVFTSWVGRARRQRKASAERQARNRAGKSRELPRDHGVTNGESPPARASAPQGQAGTEGTDGTETGGAGGADDPWNDPEGEALTWLAKHGVSLTPGNGYHRALIGAVEQHGVNAVIGMLDRLAAAGVHNGDAKGFVFGAKDALDQRTRPNLRDLEREEREEERATVRRNRKPDPLIAEIKAALDAQEVAS